MAEKKHHKMLLLIHLESHPFADTSVKKYYFRPYSLKTIIFQRAMRPFKILNIRNGIRPQSQILPFVMSHITKTKPNTIYQGKYQLSKFLASKIFSRQNIFTSKNFRVNQFLWVNKFFGSKFGSKLWLRCSPDAI